MHACCWAHGWQNIPQDEPLTVLPILADYAPCFISTTPTGVSIAADAISIIPSLITATPTGEPHITYDHQDSSLTTACINLLLAHMRIKQKCSMTVKCLQVSG